MASRARKLVALAVVLTATFSCMDAQVAQAACGYPTTYPGDGAPKAQIAAWMAGAATQAAIPAELPVMGALAESGLTNVPAAGNGNLAGYFQMRTDIWNTGDYTGFPDQPQLQLQWFVDQATNVRKQHWAQGDTTYGSDPSSWGEWVADVLRPPQLNRGQYQPQLAQAQQLIAAGCAAADGTQLIPDSILPALNMSARRIQNPARTGALVAAASCANEDCLLRAAGAVAVPHHGVFRMLVAPQQAQRGQRLMFKLALSPRQRQLLASAAHSGQCALGAIRVVAANDGGWRISSSRTVWLGPLGLCGV